MLQAHQNLAVSERVRPLLYLPTTPMLNGSTPRKIAFCRLTAQAALAFHYQTNKFGWRVLVWTPSTWCPNSRLRLKIIQSGNSGRAVVIKHGRIDAWSLISRAAWHFRHIHGLFCELKGLCSVTSAAYMIGFQS